MALPINLYNLFIICVLGNSFLFACTVFKHPKGLTDLFQPTLVADDILILAPILLAK
jgi:hypothetical protein